MHIKCFILFLVLFKYTFADQDNYFINSLRVIGNESISEEEIIFLIRQKPPNILFRRPIFDPRLLKLDALTIKNYYYTKGFLDVSIKDSYTLNDGFIDLSFEIIEGKQYFISEICKNYNRKEFVIDDFNYLLNYNWPGNVRELRNLIERIAILSPGDDNEKLVNIIKESLSKSIEDDFSVTETLAVPLKEARESFEKQYLISQLKKFSGNISKTAKFIGMERSALHRKLKLLGVKDLN